MAQPKGHRIEGLAELVKSLDGMEKKMRRTITRKSVTAGSAVVRKRMRKLAPKGQTGNLRRSVRSKTKVKKNGRIAWATITPRLELQAHHRHWVVRGTETRFHRSGKSVGAMPGFDFVGQAFDETRNEASRVMLETADRLLSEAWARG